MNMMKRLKGAVAVAMLLSAGVANAGLYQFDLSGDYTASWQLDSTPVPSIGFTGDGFYVEDVRGRFQGSDSDRASLWFFNARLGGGLEIDA